MASKVLSLKSVGDFVSKNWEKLPDIIATANDIRDAVKGKKGTSYVQEFRETAQQAGKDVADAKSNITTIKGVVLAVAVVIGIVVLFFVFRKGR